MDQISKTYKKWTITDFMIKESVLNPNSSKMFDQPFLLLLVSRCHCCRAGQPKNWRSYCRRVTNNWQRVYFPNQVLFLPNHNCYFCFLEQVTWHRILISLTALIFYFSHSYVLASFSFKSTCPAFCCFTSHQARTIRARLHWKRPVLNKVFRFESRLRPGIV